MLWRSGINCLYGIATITCLDRHFGQDSSFHTDLLSENFKSWNWSKYKNLQMWFLVTTMSVSELKDTFKFILKQINWIRGLCSIYIQSSCSFSLFAHTLRQTDTTVESLQMDKLFSGAKIQAKVNIWSQRSVSLGLIKTSIKVSLKFDWDIRAVTTAGCINSKAPQGGFLAYVRVSHPPLIIKEAGRLPPTNHHCYW